MKIFSILAFSQEEQDAIVETKVINPDSPANKNSIEGGNDTLDKVYLLSRQEASDEALGFNSDLNIVYQQIPERQVPNGG